MPVTPTYPGVYIQELPSGVRTLAGVATSITAFVGRARRGPVNDPVRIANYGGYERNFGGLWEKSDMSYAVQQYFLNGGTDAIIVRVHKTAASAGKIELKKANTTLVFKLAAANAGSWGNELTAKVDHGARDLEEGESAIFNLSLRDGGTGAEEDFFNVSLDANHPRFVTAVLEQGSALATVSTIDKAYDGTAKKYHVPDQLDYSDPKSKFGAGTDGGDINSSDLIGALVDGANTGMYSLEKADLFNLLCLPAMSKSTSPGWDAAAKYCQDRRAMLIVDSDPGWAKVGDVTGGLDALMTRSKNAAIYYPWLMMADPLKENRLRAFAPCGAVAGLIARTDSNRGVWKAPAGIEATLRGVTSLSVKLSDSENGILNPLGVNCLRSFPVIGRVIWGSRTLKGADILADQWKYLPIRRLALMIEESLFRGTQWVVFEPNDEPLWAQIRLNLGAYMHGLFRQGAFEGSAPADAYFVKCDSETTIPADQNLGQVNIVVGFAPLKPAEFVIIKIKQMSKLAS